jgi:hypothetical protein
VQGIAGGNLAQFNSGASCDPSPASDARLNENDIEFAVLSMTCAENDFGSLTDHLGPIVQFVLRCEAAGAATISLAGIDGTFVLDAAVAPWNSSVGESATINCVDQFDSDSDGCADVEELGSTPSTGGLRNPSPDGAGEWDFFDTNGSKKIDALDIGLVRAHFDAAGPLAPGEEQYDRSIGSAPWAPGPPDDRINAVDIALVRSAFGHTCQAAP